ncbi:MAG: hypothetical protein IH603_00030 [Burkholderia vietnamiensis]|nr:hypothetical protein [Burkholderia vietnamiensis]
MFKRPSKDSSEPKLVWFPVTIHEPRDGGGAIDHKVKVQYEIISEAEKDQEIREGGDEGFLERVVRDWKEFMDQNGAPVACTPESRADFFDISYVRIAVVNGYFVAQTGGRRKNL